MELQQISENSYIVNTLSPVLTATVLIYDLGDGEIVLIDTGCAPFKELFSEFDSRGWHVCAVLCTHLHWDHVFNNEPIVKSGGTIYAHEKEKRERPFALFQVTYPITYVSAGTLKIRGQKFELIHAPGHTPGHCAVLTPDGVLHMGDALMGESELFLSKLPFMEDVETAMTSMIRLKKTDCGVYVLSHNGTVVPENLDALVDANIKKEVEIYHSIRDFVSHPMKIDEFSESYMRSLNITSSLILSSPEMKMSAENRLKVLIRAGELESDGETVYPKG